MNAVQKFLAEISDTEVRQCVREIKERGVTGILPSGLLRTLSVVLRDTVDMSYTDSMSLIEYEVLHRAAYLYADNYIDD